MSLILIRSQQVGVAPPHVMRTKPGQARVQGILVVAGNLDRGLEAMVTAALVHRRGLARLVLTPRQALVPADGRQVMEEARVRPKLLPADPHNLT